MATCEVCSKTEQEVKLLWCAACLQVSYCSKEHQKQDWGKHKTSCKQKKHIQTPLAEVCYEIRPTTSKGLGMYARRDIKKGECIVNEYPLIKCSSRDSFNRAFAALSSDEKAVVFSLHDDNPNTEPGSIPKAFSIYRTNSVSLSDENAGVSGLFPIYSRINHSCTPNCNHYFNPTLGKEMVHAVKDIAAGEEILTSYLEVLAPRKQRQALFETKFNFKCECAVCSTPDTKESDARRTEAKQIQDDIPSFATASWRKTLQMVERAITLLTEEGCAETYASALYYDAFQSCAAFGQMQEAKKYAEKAAVAGAIYRGADWDVIKKYKLYASNPKMHPAWGLKR